MAIQGAEFVRCELKPGNETRAAPKLNVVTVNKALGPFNRFEVGDADKPFESLEVAVILNDIGPIFCHGCSRWIRRKHHHLQSPIDAEG